MANETLKIKSPASGARRGGAPQDQRAVPQDKHSVVAGLLAIVTGGAALGVGALTIASGGAAFPLIMAAMAISAGPAAVISGTSYLLNQLSEEQFSGISDTLGIVSSPFALATYTGSHLAGTSDGRALLFSKVASAGTGAWSAAHQLNDVLRLREAAGFITGYELGSAAGEFVSVSFELSHQQQAVEKNAIQARRTGTPARESDMSRGQQRAEAMQRTREASATRERPSEAPSRQREAFSRGETRPGAGDRSQWDGPRNGGKGSSGGGGKGSSGGGGKGGGGYKTDLG